VQSAARKTAVVMVFATIIWESADAFMDILVGLTSQYSLSVNKSLCTNNSIVLMIWKGWLLRT
jgi:hypothetical protein